VEAVEPIGLQCVAFVEAIVEDAAAAPNYHLGRLGAVRRSGGPRKGKPRCKVKDAGDVSLALVTQAITQGEVWSHAPVVLSVDAEVDLRNVGFRIARSDAQLRRVTTQSANRQRIEPGIYFRSAVALQAIRKNWQVGKYIALIVDGRNQGAGKRVCAAKIVRVDVRNLHAPQAPAKLECVSSPGHGEKILQFPAVIRI